MWTAKNTNTRQVDSSHNQDKNAMENANVEANGKDDEKVGEGKNDEQDVRMQNHVSKGADVVEVKVVEETPGNVGDTGNHKEQEPQLNTFKSILLDPRKSPPPLQQPFIGNAKGTSNQQLFRRNAGETTNLINEDRVNSPIQSQNSIHEANPTQNSPSQSENLVGGTSKGNADQDSSWSELPFHNDWLCPNLYTESRIVRPPIGERMGGRLNADLSSLLVAEFSEEEVWNIIRTCDGNKAPGPDGCNMLSIKQGWSFMKKDIMDFLKEFHKEYEYWDSLASNNKIA
ncbi:hypothetical protein Vadar_033160 [Vaccinium darrowii]|uniref:Uncharacterized protein n=1 Tax=Vaccinium darrowii TaxID=229202 RepID=A0ACB7Z7S6_9ERIC|nr:hypothetical protein Vadar_033160 [Vaccinium darrowii]